ncbi:hypothetical protein C8J56DRAFT_1081673 [Mycena floridula]|nr:hypothetical protein C8J56DRAFT_1081673 [Mycena floridula]
MNVLRERLQDLDGDLLDLIKVRFTIDPVAPTFLMSWTRKQLRHHKIVTLPSLLAFALRDDHERHDHHFADKDSVLAGRNSTPFSRPKPSGRYFQFSARSQVTVPAELNEIVQYCIICGGPPGCIGYQVNPQGGFISHEIPGLTHGDMQWLETVVLLYADCISPSGGWHWSSWSVDAYAVTGHYYGNPQLKPEDPIQVPNWASENRPGSGSYRCDADDSPPLAHELCIRLAAEWSRKLFPNKFGALEESRTEPSKFLWSPAGPSTEFFCNLDLNRADAETIAFQAKGKKAWEELGHLESKGISIWDQDFPERLYGYDTLPAWAQARDQDYNHEEEYGIQHLKRPDCFPQIHPLSESAVAADIPIPTLFPVSVTPIPLEIILHILTNVADLHALECLSRDWRSLLSSPSLQGQFWLKRAKRLGYTPTAADWTESAERVRAAMLASSGPGPVMNWKSSSMRPSEACI